MSVYSVLGTALVVGACVVSLAACGSKERAATQVAAKVNSSEITVHQVNYILQHTPGLTAELAPQAKKEVVERLIDQEVLVQQALANKLDRDPKTLAALEATRREVLSRTYLERAAQAASRPDAVAIKAYYDEHPALFQQRRIYTFNEIVLPSRPANWEDMTPALGKAQNLVEAAKVLKAGGVPAPISIDVTRAAEQLPVELVDRFAQAGMGEVLIYPAASAIVVGEIRSIKAAPIDLAQATPAIENYLTNQGRARAARSELERLRSAAEVAYHGEFVAIAQQDEGAAGTAAAVSVDDAAAPADTAGSTAGGGKPADGAKPADGVKTADGATPADDAKAAMDRGLRGLK